jgi:membrane protease YdiL (CAAX protease family)
VVGTLRLSGERLRDLGFHGDRLGRQLWVGALWGLGIFILANFLLDPVAEAVFPSIAADRETVTGMFKNLWHLPLLLMLGIFKGGCLEECWRIFVLTRFERAFARVGLLFALAADSIMFGLGHAYQGASGIITLAGVGLAYAGVYLRKRRAMEAVAAHAVYDIIAISLGFLIYHGR